MLETIRKAWGWIGLEPTEVIAISSFGNLIVRAINGAFWRICPEEWSCEQIARNADDFATRWNDDEFRMDWEMSRLVKLAKQRLGPLPDGRCYCLKVPSVIGGSYEATNFETISLTELISFSGYMAARTRDVPDGGQVVIEVRKDERQI
ncbi:MAG TPA: T6SS immunity protein Tdi1 domain-containing protein [Gemmataceae bacterium]|nr:T6SS immunity protein Tdi1 domain-containing protein [Gemmataceae bacterium]